MGCFAHQRSSHGASTSSQPAAATACQRQGSSSSGARMRSSATSCRPSRAIQATIGIISARPEWGPCLAALWVEPEARGRGIGEALADVLRASFRRMTPQEAAALKPLRIRVVTVKANDTLATLSARMMGTDRKLDLFRLINAMQITSTVKPGDKVKIISE